MDLGPWARRLARPAVRDIALAAAWAALGVILWVFGVYGLWQSIAVIDAPPWVFLLTLAGVSVAVTQRSRFPFAALGVGAIIAAVDVSCGGSLGTVLALTDLIYAAMKYGSDRGVNITLRASGIGALAVLLALLIVSIGPGRGAALPVELAQRGVLSASVQWVLIILVSGLWGWNVRSEGTRTRAVLAVEQARETRLLRHRIAHELHDLVANQIAVAGLHVEAAKLQAAHRGDAASALDESLQRATDGTAAAQRELRTLITVLTAVEESEGVEPVPLEEQLRDLDRLLPAGRALAWAPGARQRLHGELAAGPDARAGVVLRVLRELLANAARHGAGDATVAAHHEDGTLTVELRNPLPASRDDGSSNSGFGISGARMLLSSVGGDLVTSRDVEFWTVTVSVPAAVTAPAPGETRP